jgi:hypothetical protein
MKLDPGMHIGLHLVFFGNSGVTPAVREGGDGQAMEGGEPKSTGEAAWSMVVATMWSATAV